MVGTAIADLRQVHFSPSDWTKVGGKFNPLQTLIAPGSVFGEQATCTVRGRARVEIAHLGRRTFIGHALAGGRSLAEVRNAAGHANVSVTSCYLHVAVEEDRVRRDLFA